MTPYRNLNGNSNVVSYEASDDSIIVVFRSGRYRHYLYSAPGKGCCRTGEGTCRARIWPKFVYFFDSKR